MGFENNIIISIGGNIVTLELITPKIPTPISEKFTPRDVYEYLVLLLKNNGATTRQANIESVKFAWRIFNQIKYRKNITTASHLHLISNFYQYLKTKGD